MESTEKELKKLLKKQAEKIEILYLINKRMQKIKEDLRRGSTNV